MKVTNIEEIKPPTIACHAAAIEYNGDEPIDAWFGGSREGAGDVRIYIQYKGKVHPLRMSLDCALPAWNPVFMRMHDQLYMFFKVGTFCDSWQTFLLEISFADDSICLGKTIMMPAGFNGPVKTAPVVMGNIAYMGSSVETHFKWTSYTETAILNDGKWFFHRGDPIGVFSTHPFKGLIQPALWMEGTVLHAMFRSSKESGYIWHAMQDDDGNWRPAMATHIPNPNSGIDVVQHSNGKRYLIYNPSAEARTPLNIAEFELNKAGNPELLKVVEIEAVSNAQAWNIGTPEVSYPYGIEAPNGDITVVYTHRRKTIKCATVVP